MVKAGYTVRYSDIIFITPGVKQKISLIKHKWKEITKAKVSIQRLTHEIKVAFSSQAMRQEPDHLMQLDAPVNDRVHGN